MTKQGILSVAIKILGIILVVIAVVFLLPILLYVLIELARAGEYRFWDEIWRFILYFAAYIVIIYIAGRVLIATGDSMAAKIQPGDAPVAAIGPNRWDKALFRSLMLVIGVGIIVASVIELIMAIVAATTTLASPRPFVPMPTALWSGYGWQAYVIPIIRILCGLVVIWLSRSTSDALYPDGGQVPPPQV